MKSGDSPERLAKVECFHDGALFVENLSLPYAILK